MADSKPFLLEAYLSIYLSIEPSERRNQPRKSGVGAMDDKHSRIRTVKQEWDEEDAGRAMQEARAQQMFLEVRSDSNIRANRGLLHEIG
jgi:hypothetical protein